PLLLHRAPTSTLFPYTTLFRSGRLPADENHVTRFLPLLRAPSLVKRGIARGDVIPAPIAKLTGYFVDPAPRALEFQVVSNRGLIDRKSTRLNSSHVAISYAVFC